MLVYVSEAFDIDCNQEYSGLRALSVDNHLNNDAGKLRGECFSRRVKRCRGAKLGKRKIGRDP
jgi:hypothetical protein